MQTMLLAAVLADFSRKNGLEIKGSKASFRFDAKKEPGELDFKYGLADQWVLGIYKFEGDTLTICLDVGTAKRPTEFSAGAGSRTNLMVYKRVTK